MSEALSAERTNAGADSACAWPGCGLARAAWFRVETKPGVGEYLAVCQRCGIKAEREPSVALRVWQEQAIGKAPRQHVDHVLAGSLLREINRVPGISRERLLAWRRMQLPQRGLGPVETRSGQPTLDEHDDDTRAALDSLARDGSVKCRRNALATAYWPIDEDDDTSEEIEPCPPVPAAAPPIANAATTSTTTAKSAKTGTTTRSTPTRGTTGTPSVTPSEPSAPPSPTTAAATPAEKPNEPATSRPPDVDTAASTPAAATSAAPVPTDPARPIAPPSLSDEVPMTTATPSPLGARLLAYLVEHPGSLTVDLESATGTDKTVVGATLNKLRHKGLARSVKASEAGKSVNRWHATAEGVSPTTAKPSKAPKAKGEPEPEPIDWRRLSGQWQDQARAVERERDEARAEVAELRAEAADVLEAVAEGGWASGLNTSDPDHRGPTLKDAAGAIREFHRFREQVWNEDDAKREAGDDWKARAERAEAELQEISRWATSGSHGCAPYTTDASRMLERLDESFAVLRGIEATLRADASKLREQLDAVSDVVVFEAEAFAPEGTMDTSEFVRHTLRALKSRLAASEARERELLDAAPALPTIDGIPLDAALRLIAEVLDIDTSEPGPATIYDLSRVLQEIGKLRVAE